MKRLFLTIAAFCLCLPCASAQDPGQGQSQPISDGEFVQKASASGMAEVNLSNIALKQSTNEDVKKFAQQMINDHTKANKELLVLANSKRIEAATTMGAEHRQLGERMAQMTGADFDKHYMAGQVKDHVEAVALFESQAKNGQDAELKKWAGDTLPHLQHHLRMARQIHAKLTGLKVPEDGGKGPGHDKSTPRASPTARAPAHGARFRLHQARSFYGRKRRPPVGQPLSLFRR